jgi:hypothetical protein
MQKFSFIIHSFLPLSSAVLLNSTNETLVAAAPTSMNKEIVATSEEIDGR